MTTQEDTDKIQALQEEVNALKAVLSKVTADNTDHVWAHFREEGTTEDISAGVRATNLPEAWDKFMDGVKYAAQKYQIVLTGSIHTEPEPAGVLSPTGTLQMSISKSPYKRVLRWPGCGMPWRVSPAR